MGFVMKKILIICALALSAVAGPTIAIAANSVAVPGAMVRDGSFSKIYVAGGNCSAKANSVAASYGNAQILSVEQNGNACVIVIRVNGKNGNPPRIITKTVSG